MKYLIFQLFSGVGFCNQLFSLESAIYLSNITDRKLILLIKNPLCHCGRSDWKYGKILELFTDDYLKYLPNGIEVYYKQIPDNINNLSKNAFHFSNKTFSNTIYKKFMPIGCTCENYNRYHVIDTNTKYIFKKDCVDKQENLNHN